VEQHSLHFDTGFCHGPLFNQSVVKLPKHMRFGSGWERRRADIMRATPPWCNLDNCQAVYRKARKLSKIKKVRYSVDHIVPLNHPQVCGLHVPWNLRAILYADNQAKGNAWWPDMWEVQERLF
jgi:hypothetical protein